MATRKKVVRKKVASRARAAPASVSRVEDKPDQRDSLWAVVAGYGRTGWALLIALGLLLLLVSVRPATMDAAAQAVMYGALAVTGTYATRRVLLRGVRPHRLEGPAQWVVWGVTGMFFVGWALLLSRAVL